MRGVNGARLDAPLRYAAPMTRHTLLAVFDNRKAAQQALAGLVHAGFSRAATHLSEADPTGQSDQPGGIGQFFINVFGVDRSESARLYADAVAGGHYVLTLMAASDDEASRAAAMLARFGALDIRGANSMQQSASMSEQRDLVSEETAYQYGVAMSQRDLYRGRPWNKVEQSLRLNWEAANPGLAWEGVKAAIRRGWEQAKPGRRGGLPG